MDAQKNAGYGQASYGQPGYGQPQTVVINQTTAVPVNDCLVCSILNLIFCNILFGAIAVAFSCMARDAYDRGDIVAGNSHAKIAKIMNIIGPVLTAIVIIIVVVYVVVIVGAAASVYG
ncbi:hypothetical protein EB796_021165 [Bugula neritina]|uniref:Uncharacterized protein n=1 Tax=Bugula neritina TaxID=10212 RepID=A0A7J7J2V6_BUGNE|nr:hypothetical protein EB796_021165 [Bugula neritina]